MGSLCDVNVLFALVTDGHQHHSLATAWFASQAADDVAVCRVAQLGLLRLLNNPHVMGEQVLSGPQCWLLWNRMIRDERFRFVALDPKGIDGYFAEYTSEFTHSHRLWPDAYLASFARAGGYTLVTLDKAFSRFAHLQTIVLG